VPFSGSHAGHARAAILLGWTVLDGNATRQQHYEDRAAPDAAATEYASAQTAQDGFADGEADALMPIAFVTGPGLKQPLHHIRPDPASGVGDLKQHEKLPTKAYVVRRNQREPTTGRHCFDGVGQEVEHHLLHAARVAVLNPFR